MIDPLASSSSAVVGGDAIRPSGSRDLIRPDSRARLRPRLRLLSAAAILLMLAPAAITLGYIARFGVNLPYWDQWDFIPTLRRFYEGRPIWADVWEPYAEQRLLFPRLLMLGLALATRYNVVAEMYASWALLAASCGLLLYIYARARPLTPSALLAFLPVPWLLFSVRGWESLLWGWQVQRYLAILCFLAAVVLLARSERLGPRFILAVAAGVGASFSLSSGLLTWPIGLIQIVLCGRVGERGAWRRQALAWTAAGAAVFFLYLKDYRAPTHHPGLGDVLRHPVEAFRFGLVALATPLSVEKEHAIAVGSVVGVIYLAALFLVARRLRTASRRPGPSPENSPDLAPVGASLPLLAVMLFGLLDMGLLVIGRSGLGVGQALASRYAAELSLGLIGLYLLLVAGDLAPDNLRVLLVGLVLGVLVAGIGTGFQRGMAEGYAMYVQRSEDVDVVATYANQDDARFARIGPEPELVKRHARWLQQSRLSLFAGQRSP